MFENTSVAIMYAVTPCHVGSGSALGVVDLPIQRERHTNWPMIQASGVKGAFRANFDKFKNKISDSDKSKISQMEELTQSIFGTDKGGNDNSGYAGSLSVCDARILAFPMRSNCAPFVWITCPAVLKRLQRDLEIAGRKNEIISFETIEQKLTESAIVINGNIANKQVLLEDYELSTISSVPNGLKRLSDEYLSKAERLLLVSDEVFNYGVSDCTQIMAQIKIDQSKGTTKEGSLRYQEELPSDTIMYTVIHWGDTKNCVEENLKADTIKTFVTEQVIANHIQVGGDETLGRGIFSLEWK